MKRSTLGAWWSNRERVYAEPRLYSVPLQIVVFFGPTHTQDVFASSQTTNPTFTRVNSLEDLWSSHGAEKTSMYNQFLITATTKDNRSLSTRARLPRLASDLQRRHALLCLFLYYPIVLARPCTVASYLRIETRQPSLRDVTVPCLCIFALPPSIFLLVFVSICASTRPHSICFSLGDARTVSRFLFTWPCSFTSLSALRQIQFIARFKIARQAMKLYRSKE